MYLQSGKLLRSARTGWWVGQGEGVGTSGIGIGARRARALRVEESVYLAVLRSLRFYLERHSNMSTRRERREHATFWAAHLGTRRGRADSAPFAKKLASPSS